MKLSVAIPSYLRPADLRRALDALTQQERPADEVLVVARRDDVETHAVVQEFAGALPIRLELVDKPGVVEAYNRALDQATGDVISFIDDDAAPHPDWARRIVEIFADEPDLAGLGGRDHIFVEGIWLEGEEPVVGVVRWYGRAIGNHHLGVGPRRDVDVLKAVNMSLRRDAVGCLRMDSRLRGTGAQWHCELKFCLDLRSQGKRLSYDPSLVVDHFAGKRHDEDQRGIFNSLAYENEIHNLTFTLFEYLRPAGRMILLSYALLAGIGSSYFGLLQGLRFSTKNGNQTWRRVAASARGICGGLKTWWAGRSLHT